MIVKLPNKSLHKISIEVKNFNEAKLIATELIKATRRVDGIVNSLFGLGMAAPQIGYNKRVILLRGGKGVLGLMTFVGVIYIYEATHILSAIILQQYTPAMHPEVQQDKPGTCPKCGMDLVVKEAKPQLNMSR